MPLFLQDQNGRYVKPWCCALATQAMYTLHQHIYIWHSFSFGRADCKYSIMQHFKLANMSLSNYRLDNIIYTNGEFLHILIQMFTCFFIRSKLCLPHLKKAKNPHILNITPPLNMRPSWYAENFGKPVQSYCVYMYFKNVCVFHMYASICYFQIWSNSICHGDVRRIQIWWNSSQCTVATYRW